jgi:hypothetical protein
MGWRSKFIFLLVVYFAGFATAIYALAPGAANEGATEAENGFTHSFLKSDEFALSFNEQMHKCLDAGKDAAHRAGAYIRSRMDRESQGSES